MNSFKNTCRSLLVLLCLIAGTAVASSDQHTNWVQYHGTALDAYRLGNLDVALDLFSKAQVIAANAGDMPTASMLSAYGVSATEQKMKKFDAAIKHLEAIVKDLESEVTDKIDPEEQTALLTLAKKRLGTLYMMQGRLDDADAQFQAVEQQMSSPIPPEIKQYLPGAGGKQFASESNTNSHSGTDAATKKQAKEVHRDESDHQRIARLIDTYTKRSIVREIVATCDGMVSMGRGNTAVLGIPPLERVTAENILHDTERCEIELDQLESNLAQLASTGKRADTREFGNADIKSSRSGHRSYNPPRPTAERPISRDEWERGVQMAAGCTAALRKNGYPGATIERICGCATTKWMDSSNRNAESVLQSCGLRRGGARRYQQ